MRRSLLLVTVSLLLAGCVSRTGVADGAQSDPRLFGRWQVNTVYITGQSPIHAAPSTRVPLEFRRDGRMIPDHRACGAPHVTAADGYLDVRSESGACLFVLETAQPAYGLSNALDAIERSRKIAYEIDGLHLTLRAGTYRIQLVKDG